MRSAARLSHLPRLLVLTLSVALAFAAPLFLASPSSATASAPAASASDTPGASVAAERRANQFGAIAVAKDAAWGSAWNYGTKAKAKRRALKHCKQYSTMRGSCRVIVTVKNKCAAAYRKQNQRLGKWVFKSATGATKKAAKRKANKKFHGDLVTVICA